MPIHLVSPTYFNYSVYLLLSMFSVLVCGPYFINMLRKFKLNQTLRLEGPQEHLSKQGTPTMGGILIFLPVFILSLIISGFSWESIILNATVLGFFLIGLADDMLIIIKGKNDGLRPKLKLFLQIMVSLFFGLALSYSGHKTHLNIPFTNNYLELGYLYIPFIVFMITGFSNAVNLTDGLDGLASGVMIIALLPLIIMLTFATGSNFSFAAIVLGLTCMGSCLGFLWFNSHPASVFMGDTGSLPLGGLFSVIAVVGNNELWMLICGIIFVLETLSVILQVAYFKRTKKRLFLMSPLHHHFEKKGWKETKVSFRFYLISVAGTLLSLTGFFYSVG